MGKVAAPACCSGKIKSGYKMIPSPKYYFWFDKIGTSCRMLRISN
jgi:hypothetical protein